MTKKPSGKNTRGNVQTLKLCCIFPADSRYYLFDQVTYQCGRRYINKVVKRKIRHPTLEKFFLAIFPGRTTAFSKITFQLSIHGRR
jgi:hypothetical protein